MRNISIGMMFGILVCIIVLSFFPLTETDQACGACGAKAWYFQIAEGEE